MLKRAAFAACISLVSFYLFVLHRNRTIQYKDDIVEAPMTLLIINVMTLTYTLHQWWLPFTSRASIPVHHHKPLVSRTPINILNVSLLFYFTYPTCVAWHLKWVECSMTNFFWLMSQTSESANIISSARKHGAGERNSGEREAVDSFCHCFSALRPPTELHSSAI